MRLQIFRKCGSIGDRVYIISRRHYNDTSNQLGLIVEIFTYSDCMHISETYSYTICVNGTNLDTCYSTNELLHVVADETSNRQVSTGDVIGLACDLHVSKIHFSRNRNWASSQSMTTDLTKVSLTTPVNSIFDRFA